MYPVILVAVALINLGTMALVGGAMAGRPLHGVFPGSFLGIAGIALWLGSFDRNPRPAWVRPLGLFTLLLFAINLVLMVVYFVWVLS